MGRTLNGRFKILEPLGSGGMGRVYRAVQSQLDRVVALKVLHPSTASSREAGFQARFLREASLTSKLRHPNTVTVIDYGQTEDGIYYIAMEYLEGKTLAQELNHVGALTWPRALAITQQICRSLREAHRLGIIHRDLKPANVMLLNEADQDLVKVLDFGLVKSIAPDLDAPVPPEVTQNGTFLGSPMYMAPEQVRNVADPRSDVYSLGVVLYQMLVGRTPFVSKDYIELIFAHYKEQVPAFSSVRPNLQIPPDIERVVRRCLEKDPARRFQNMDELLEALREANVNAGGNSGIFDRPGVVSGQYASPVFQSGQYASPLFANVTGQDGSSGDAEALDISVELPDSEQRARALRRRNLGIGLGATAVALGLLAVFLLAGGSKAPDAPIAPQVAAAAPKVQEVPALTPVAGQPAPVRFNLRTEPPGAHIFYKGKERGITPFVLEVPPGPEGTVTAELTFALDGYSTETVLAGGSGEVVLIQRLEKRAAGPARGVRNAHARSPSSGPFEAEEAVAAAPPSTSTREVRAAPPEDVVPGKPGSVNMATDATRAPAGAVPAASAGKASEQAVVPAGLLGASTLRTPGSAPETVLPFDDAMTRPELIQGRPITFSREARAARIEGNMVAKCTITTSGKVRNCRVLKSLPFMNQAVIDSLESSTYKPATLDSKPVTVDYVFNVRLLLPNN